MEDDSRVHADPVGHLLGFSRKPCVCHPERPPPNVRPEERVRLSTSAISRALSATAEPRPGSQGKAMSFLARLGQNPWFLAGVLTVLALFATLSNAPGRYIGDNRFEFYWAPFDLLQKHLSIWDPNRGIGRMRWDFWPTTTAYVALLRGLGASPALAERIYHATLLTIAGTGAAAVMRHFRHRISVEHWIAAFVYAFNPFSVLFLLPSNLFIGYALAPWLLYAFLTGVKGDRPSRWAAVFALLVFVPGNINYPAVAFASLALVPAAVFVVVVERSTSWRRVGAWFVRAAVLTILVSAASLAATRYSSAINAENLASTEGPLDIGRASSWPESWRGLGFWLAYWIDSRGPNLPQLANFFSVRGTLLSFVVPCTALVALWRSSWRPRLLFGALMVLGLVLMVGAYPVDDPSPYGRTLLWLYDNVPGVLAMRSTHKAGAILMLGVAALVGIAVAGGFAWMRVRHPRLAIVALIGAVAVLFVSSFGFWTGRLYPTTPGITTIPRYWKDAADFVNRRPGEGRVLVLPSTIDGAYIWGDCGGSDDIVVALIKRPVVAREQLKLYQGTKESANLIAALDDYVNAGRYEPGVIGPIARRLGIRWILIRNDLNWIVLGRPRPNSLDGLRADPGLVPLRSFGRPGQNVQRLFLPVLSERKLPPVEVFEVKDFDGIARAETAPPLLVSGDGAAWPGLASHGLLSETGPVRYTGAAGTRELIRRLRDGSGIIVTDSNRRQNERIPIHDSVARASYTFTPDEALDEGAASLFHRPGTKAVAWFPNHTRISASGYGFALVPDPFFRPSNAFDGNPATSWAISPLFNTGEDQWIRATFQHPRVMSSVELLSNQKTPTKRDPNPWRVTHAIVSFSDGVSIPVDLSAGRSVVHFPPRRTHWVKVTIDGKEGVGIHAYGFAEIVIPGIDGREFIQLPDDVARRADRAPKLRALVARAPIAYEFGRHNRLNQKELERVLRRRFRTVGERAYSVRGELEFEARRPNPTVTALLNDTPNAGCRDVGVTIDGHPVPLEVDTTRESATASSSETRRTVPVVSCEDVTLAGGWHLLDTGASTIRRLVLSSGEIPAVSTTATAATAARGRDTFGITGTTSQPAYVISGESSSPEWSAQVGSEGAAKGISLDTQAAWPITAEGAYRIDGSLDAQSTYRWSLFVTAASLVLCLWLVVRGRLR